jgi:dipeptidyl aminopeptidase/acylaminoacyl peptidase
VKSYRFLITFLVLFLICLISTTTLKASELPPFGIDDVFKIIWVSDPQISPDGKIVVFEAEKADAATNHYITHLWMVSAKGGEPRQLTTLDSSDTRPRFSPDGKKIAFLSSRSGTKQIWTIYPGGGEVIQLTDFPVAVSKYTWSPDGKWIAFTAEVLPGIDPDSAMEVTGRWRDEKKESKVKAELYEKLLYRHWNIYDDKRVSHLFIMDSEGKNPPIDLTPDLEFDVLQWDHAVASVGLDYDWSPDSKSIVFATNLNPKQELNYDVSLYKVDITFPGKIDCITPDQSGAESCPRFSPDGEYLAYRMTDEPGYEADQGELIIRNLENNKERNLTESWDRSVGEIFWSKDGSRIYTLASDQGEKPVFSISVKDGKIETIVGGWNSNLTPLENDRLLFAHQDGEHPKEIHTITKGKLHKLTNLNHKLFSEKAFPKMESFWMPRPQGDSIQGFTLKPFDFNPKKKYPLVLYIHGGPEGMYGQYFSTVRNLLASQGYVVLFLNPSGSTGYGEKLKRSIQYDWGGQCYRDLMMGVDYIISRGYIDTTQMVAMGGSFGGYMTNWIATQTDRFKCLVSHASVFNLESKYGTTDELFFVEWEFGGPPWENRENYRRFSPHNYAHQMKTPMLVIVGELDYRTPAEQSEQLFTTLQRQGIDSWFLRFPDEGHSVNKPLNYRLWLQTIIKWLSRYIEQEDLEKPIF